MSGALLEGMCPSVVEMVIWKTLQGVDGASAVTYGCACVLFAEMNLSLMGL